MPARSKLQLSRFACLAAVFLFFGQIGQAQRTSLPSSAETPRNEIGVFGVLPIANGSLKGTTSDRQFFMFGFSYSRLLWHTHVCDVRWVSEIMPLELLREPFDPASNVQTFKSFPFTQSRFTYGTGTNPAGADVVFLPGHKWQPYAGVHGGFSYFTRNVLSSQAAQFNFMLDGRAGLRLPLRGARTLSIAYMFQHMSNAYTALENPGVDSHMIQVVYSFPFRFSKAK